MVLLAGFRSEQGLPPNDFGLLQDEEGTEDSRGSGLRQPDGLRDVEISDGESIYTCTDVDPRPCSSDDRRPQIYACEEGNRKESH